MPDIRPTPDRAELRELALKVVADEQLPISTNELADQLGLNPFERSAYLYPILNQAAKAGRLEKMIVPGHYCRFWRTTAAAAAEAEAWACTCGWGATSAVHAPWCAKEVGGHG